LTIDPGFFRSRADGEHLLRLIPEPDLPPPARPGHQIDDPGPRGRNPRTARAGGYIVLALAHDLEHPELDLWEPGRGTPGDRILGKIGKELVRWLQEEYGVRARLIPYQIYDGGIYLKDAACMGGIGRMGHNNLVLVPGYGPKIRFRAVWVDLDCPEEPSPEGEDPCAGCEEYCTRACPMDAFSTGNYSREQCLARMNTDKKSGRERIDHCRACELACPGGDEA